MVAIFDLLRHGQRRKSFAMLVAFDLLELMAVNNQTGAQFEILVDGKVVPGTARTLLHLTLGWRDGPRGLCVAPLPAPPAVPSCQR